MCFGRSGSVTECMYTNITVPLNVFVSVCVCERRARLFVSVFILYFLVYAVFMLMITLILLPFAFLCGTENNIHSILLYPAQYVVYAQHIPDRKVKEPARKECERARTRFLGQRMYWMHQHFVYAVSGFIDRLYIYICTVNTVCLCFFPPFCLVVCFRSPLSVWTKISCVQ